MRQIDLQALSLLLGRHQGDILLKHLWNAEVRFCIIGGCALAAWGLREMTSVDDMDILVEATEANATKVLDGLTLAGVSLFIPAAVLAQPNKQLPIKNRNYYAELLTPMKGFSFESVYSSAEVVNLFEIEVRVASLLHLKQLKLLAVSELGSQLAKHEADLRALREATE